YCQPCHGGNGGGLPYVAPPMNRSDWVTGNPFRLAAILLYGATGPIVVSGRDYRSPQVGEDMPGMSANAEATDELLADLMNYIRHAWNNNARPVTPDHVATVRKRFGARREQFTM